MEEKEREENQEDGEMLVHKVFQGEEEVLVHRGFKDLPDLREQWECLVLRVHPETTEE